MVVVVVVVLRRNKVESWSINAKKYKALPHKNYYPAWDTINAYQVRSLMPTWRPQRRGPVVAVVVVVLRRNKVESW